MLTVKLKKKGKKLDMIRASIKKLDNQKVEVGYFSSQGKHYSGYSYPALAQALSLGVFPNGLVRTPMPFLERIGDRAFLSMGRSIKVKRAFRTWGRKLDKKGNPLVLLNAIGEYFILQSKDVFGNPSYFPESPNNKTPVFETGQLKRKLTYRTSFDNRVRRT
jgi:hypothetical protein